MTARAGVAEFTQVSDVVSHITFNVPEQEAKALSTEVQAHLANIPTKVTDLETCRRAKESLPLLKKAEDRVVTFFRDIKGASYNAWKAIVAKETEQLKPIQDLRKVLNGEVYRFEQAEQRRREEEARKIAEEERQRLQAQALEEAAALSETAPEMAEQIVEQAIAAPLPTVVLPDTTVEVEGVSSQANYKWHFVGTVPNELGETIPWKKLTGEQQARIRSLIPRDYMVPDESGITKIVKAMGPGAAKLVPGIAVFDAGTVRTRG